MVQPRVNGVKLKQAIENFGSLQKAVDFLREEKKELEAEVEALKRERNISEEATRKCLLDIERLRDNIKEHTETLNGLSDKIKQYGFQYQFAESLVAMLLTSPSQDESLEKLVDWLGKLATFGWQAVKQETTLRGIFVYRVMGLYLHCYRCGNCGAKFIVNRKPQGLIKEYKCPACGMSLLVKADDSFLEAMLNPDEPIEVRRSQQLQKELEKFLDIPCRVCGKLLPNAFTREQILTTFQEQWRHPECTTRY